MILQTNKIILLLLTLALTTAGCLRVKYLPEGDIEQGMASWYGPNFDGKVTSSNEIYDMFDLTAAHQTLPFGTHVIVTNLNNNKAVTVRINDRGPFVKGRIIDLSFAAAKVLDMVGPGVVPVSIEVLKEISPPKTAVKYFVQIGSFSQRQNALGLRKELGNRYGDVVITDFQTERRTYFRVRIKADTRADAEAIAGRLAQDGYTVVIFEEQSRQESRTR